MDGAPPPLGRNWPLNWPLRVAGPSALRARRAHGPCRDDIIGSLRHHHHDDVTAAVHCMMGARARARAARAGGDALALAAPCAAPALARPTKTATAVVSMSESSGAASQTCA